MAGNRTAPSPDQPDDLRARAEKRAREQAASAPKSRETPLPERRRLNLELHVHQIELEMQNEELSAARAELESSRARYFDLYDLAPVGYLTVNQQGVILEANLTAATLLGAARGALADTSFSRFILHEDQDSYYFQCRQLADQGTRQSWDLRMVRADDSVFWAHLEVAPGQHGETRITLIDISERKLAEARSARADARLQQLQRAESLERMAGAIAHHFNNKLQVVIGNLELAIGASAQDPETSPFLKASLGAALEAAGMSTLMLTFLGQAAGELERLDLSLVCRQALPLLQTALSTGLPLEADCPAPGPIVSGYEEQLQQLLLNLVTNAREASKAGEGVVRVAITTVDPATIPNEQRFPVDWEPQQVPYACLEVTDSGRGIAENDLEKIFEPFYSDKQVGRGLGLAVVLGILRTHGGAVSVSSKPGRGSTFRVFLPLSGAAALPPARQVPDFEAGGTVLLVEDEDLVRSVTAALLRGSGFSVLEAGGGSEALEVLGGHPGAVRLVLCDLTMPGMDGWETLTALRQRVPGIPVILTSVYDRARVMAGNHAEQPQAYLRKPYRSRELVEAIRLALAVRRTPG